jgi:hypothetical protein
MTHTSGIYQHGKVILDQSVDWPDGIHVSVVCENAGASGPDRRVDGSAWEDSPEAVQEWLAWFDALQPVLAGRDLEIFESSLLANRLREKEMLSIWEARLNDLSK